MPSFRSLLFTLLPKVALSRTCGLLCSTPLPRPVRIRLFRWFANRYGVDVEEAGIEPANCRSLQEFFRRPLRADARPIAGSALVWPCDGRIVTVGPIRDGRIEQVKGNDYALADLLGDAELAQALDGGSQATIYLAPGDYHRVHAPFAATIEGVRAQPGTLFPVNPSAVRDIARLFVRNSRHVFRCRLPDGSAAAIVMVGAYNVGGTTISRSSGRVAAGDEVGQFGFGSTVVVAVGPTAAPFRATHAECRVCMGADANGPDAARPTDKTG